LVPSETNDMETVTVEAGAKAADFLKTLPNVNVPTPPVTTRLIVTPGKSVDGDTATVVVNPVAGPVSRKILPVVKSRVDVPVPVRTGTVTTLEDITPLVTTGGPWSDRPPVGSIGRTLM
jgi:hypothetical protein